MAKKAAGGKRYGNGLITKDLEDTALKSSKPQIVRVEFDPPLLGYQYEEVKPCPLGMKVDADSALGTVRPNLVRFDSLLQSSHTSPSISHHHNCNIQVKTPQITHFELPFQIRTTASLLLLINTSIAPPIRIPSSGGSCVQSVWGSFRVGLPYLSWAIVIIAHTGEGAYAATLAAPRTGITCRGISQ